MTNTIAAILALLIVAFFGYDVTQNDRQITLFLAREFVDLLQVIAFWR